MNKYNYWKFIMKIYNIFKLILIKLKYELLKT